MGLHEIAGAFKFLKSLLTRFEFANEPLVARDHLCDFFLDCTKVFLGERLFAIEVIKEPGVGGRAVAQLGFGKELEHCRREHVRRGVAHNFQSLGILFGHEFEAGVLV